jgi:hypothetical protein
MDFVDLTRKVAYLRIGYGIGAFLSPKAVTVAIGGRPSQVTPVAKGFARVFGTRDTALGVITLGSEDLDPAVRRKLLLVQAAVDAADGVAMVALAKRQGSRLPLLMAVPAGIAVVAVQILAAQQLGAAPATPVAAQEPAFATA